MSNRLLNFGNKYVTEAKRIQDMCIDYCELELERSRSLQDVYGVTHFSALLEILKDPIDGMLIGSLFQNISQLLTSYEVISEKQTQVIDVIKRAPFSH